VKRLLIYVLTVLLLGLCQGCIKPANDNPAYPVPQDAMDFFVNFDPGTCWVYKDTINQNSYDTIELMSKKTFCVTPDGDIPNNDGFQLYYKPGHSRDYTVFIEPSKDNSCYVNICEGQFYAMGQNSGEFAFDNNMWTQNIFSDSISVGNKIYHNELHIKSFIGDYSDLQFVKNVGLVSYANYPIIKPGLHGKYGVYMLVATFKK